MCFFRALFVSFYMMKVTILMSLLKTGVRERHGACVKYRVCIWHISTYISKSYPIRLEGKSLKDQRQKKLF